MSISLPNLGGTMTGGSSTSLTIGTNNSAGRSSFITSSHTRLAPRTIEILTSAAKTTAADPGVAKSQVRINFADRTAEEGCCTVQAGLVAFAIDARWHLNQPEALVDEAIDYLQSIVFTQEFRDALVKGVLPS
jgi:hypothetical protein